MPYPVLPPPPPSIVNYALPEDTSSSPSASVASPLVRSPTIHPTSSTLIPRGSEPERFPQGRIGYFVANQTTPPSVDDKATVASQASLLGGPLQIGEASTLEAIAPISYQVVRVPVDFNQNRQNSLSSLPQPTLRGQPVPRTGSGGQTTANSSPQARSDAQATQAILNRVRLPILEEIAQAPAERVPVPTPNEPTPTPSGGQTLIIPEQSNSPTSPPAQPESSPPPPSPTSPPPQTSPPPTTPPNGPGSATGNITGPPQMGEVVELNADRQQYDTFQRVFSAQGNAVMRFRGAVLRADTLRVNLPNRTAEAEGNIILTRGDQVLRGQRLVYNFVQQQGTVYAAGGEIFLPSTSRDFEPALPTDVSAGNITTPLSQTVTANQPTVNQPAQGVTSPGGVSISFGAGREGNANPQQAATGSLRRLRFEADRIDFTALGWTAQNVRITNDPFSPPELELRSSYVTFTRLTPLQSEIRARSPHLVFDQGFSLPLLVDRAVIDRRRRNPGLFQIGFDQEDRGGLFIERTFGILSNPILNFSLTPQILLQRALSEGGSFFDAANFGLIARLDADLGPQTSFRGIADFTSLNPKDFDDHLRASLRARQQIGTHQLAVEYVYRDRLFNGSLGFQNVQSSIGFVVTSPSITLSSSPTSSLNFSYQGGVQYVNARTDFPELLAPIRSNDRISLTRAQGSAALNWGTLLWSGTPLPATQNEGLKYSPNPVVPYLYFYTGLRGVFSNYSSGDNQASLTGTVGLIGQLGHFSRDFLDYTAFNLSYSQTALAGKSPFLFDRVADQQVLSVGVVQQLFGPLRIGFQSSINLDRSREIDTEYILEYSRRTYALTLRYNPVRQVGSIGLQINDFNWTSTPEPFSGSPETSTVEGGVRQTD